MRTCRILFVFVMLFTLVGCTSGAANSSTKELTVTVDGQMVELSAPAGSMDKAREDNRVTQAEIFLPILDMNKSVKAQLGSEMILSCPDGFNTLYLFDALLTEEGTSYFNKSIFMDFYDLAENREVAFTLDHHRSEMLSSSMVFLEDGARRGFYAVLESDEGTEAYCFVVHMEGYVK